MKKIIEKVIGAFLILACAALLIGPIVYTCGVKATIVLIVFAALITGAIYIGIYLLLK